MTTLRTTLAAALLATAASAAVAQDLTGMDITALYNGMAADQTAMMNAQLGDILWQLMNNPQVQAMYQQAVYNGQFYGNFQDFAYQYAATAGFTPDGMARARQLNGEIQRQTASQIQTMQTSPQGYYDAYGNWVNGFNQNGLAMSGNW